MTHYSDTPVYIHNADWEWLKSSQTKYIQPNTYRDKAKGVPRYLHVSLTAHYNE